MRLSRDPNHPRFIPDALRQVASDARADVVLHRRQAATEVMLAEACERVATTLDTCAGLFDPTRRHDAGTVGAVLASAVEEMRVWADKAKVAEEIRVHDLYNDARLILEGAYGRYQAAARAHTNGRT